MKGVSKVNLEQEVLLALGDCREILVKEDLQDQQAPRVLQVHQVYKVYKAQEEQRDLLGYQALLVLLGPRVRLERLACQDFQALMVYRDILALRDHLDQKETGVHKG